MSKQVSYKTPSGRGVKFEIITSRELEHDGINYTKPCYELDVTLDQFGLIMGGSMSLDHQYWVEYGTRYVNGKDVQLKITLNDDARALISEYNTERRARQDKADKIDREYQDHVNKVDFAMTLNGRTY